MCSFRSKIINDKDKKVLELQKVYDLKGIGFYEY